MKTVIFGALGIIAAGVLLSFVMSWPVMWLWNNCLIGAVDGVHEVSWTQAWGISVLCGILFQSHVSSSK